MTPVRIYADFNALIDPGSADRPGVVHLDRLGTLRDLCAARAVLREGMPLVLYMDSDIDVDIAVDAVARWKSDPESAEGGYWVGEFDPSGFRDVPTVTMDSVSNWFPCGSCASNLAEQIQRTGLSSSTRCAHCDARIHAAIAAPESAD